MNRSIEYGYVECPRTALLKYPNYTASVLWKILASSSFFIFDTSVIQALGYVLGLGY